ncbi:HD-GYP domain-containing protein [Paenibacillus psychroresistens]|uniref:HD-GYP domain-containing protein n=1 Tax=Paenibacillus psychroresistens TaxID=1778678 RepID=A0A6B8RD02_9BACL|nr:HD-GYP domain-containing protein [Paenibacillus psychroresistens]QGQ93435.1 HD-GYP domain-containing protein [Paenibacillus psychroresistens]
MGVISVPVSQLKSGDQIFENVLTKRGNLLFEKGRFVTPKEIEILRAFFVAFVSIESRDTEATEENSQNQQDDLNQADVPFFEKYDNLVKLMRKVFHDARNGQIPPVLEIRTQLEATLQYIDQYNILTFVPKNVRMGEYLIHHSVMVCLTSYQLAKWHNFQQKDWMPIALAGLLHDIGNVKIDSAIFEKSSKLTTAEFDEVRKHTVFGYQIIKNMPAINEGVKLAALQHHEREDGSGYPLSLKGDKIHIYSKLLAIADIFHAMTNERAYRKVNSPYLVLEDLLKESFGKLDPTLVQTFINRVTSLQNGTLVRLSDNRLGEIVFSDRSYPTRPWISVNGVIVNLMVERSLYIREVIAKFQ